MYPESRPGFGADGSAEDQRVDVVRRRLDLGAVNAALESVYVRDRGEAFAAIVAMHRSMESGEVPPLPEWILEREREGGPEWVAELAARLAGESTDDAGDDQDGGDDGAEAE